MVAVLQSEPSKASGIDGALKTLGSQPYGQVLLILAGVGIALYGLSVLLVWIATREAHHWIFA